MLTGRDEPKPIVDVVLLFLLLVDVTAIILRLLTLKKPPGDVLGTLPKAQRLEHPRAFKPRSSLEVQALSHDVEHIPCAG